MFNVVSNACQVIHNVVAGTTTDCYYITLKRSSTTIKKVNFPQIETFKRIIRMNNYGYYNKTT